tara:strand:+ start:819 stop:1580 length:762 start_codon:yes stop_codon:yes gene_type:complete
MKVDIYPVYKEFQYLLELYPPKQANKFLPDWYKNQKIVPIEQRVFDDKIMGAKQCPAIQEDITNGIIIPAWSDVFLSLKEGVPTWTVPIGNSIELDMYGSNGKKFPWIETHPDVQIEGMNLHSTNGYGLLKFSSPYFFQTPPGYGIHFTDPFYHHRRSIKVLPGTVDTDIWHEVNFPFEFLYDIKKEDNFNDRYVIKAGDPLIMITPYKKSNEKIALNVNKYDEKFIAKRDKQSIEYYSMTHDWKKYKDNNSK